MAQQKFILQLKNVVKRFGGITASNDITINVPEGSIYGIIGPNGAGKTTLFNMITGVYDSTEGTVLFEGRRLTDSPPTRSQPGASLGHSRISGYSAI